MKAYINVNISQVLASDAVICLMASPTNENKSNFVFASPARWTLDYGATNHICFARSYYSSLEFVYPYKIRNGDKASVKATCHGP